MSWGWIIAGVIVATTALSVLRLFRRLILPFSLAAGVLLALHAQANPGEAALGLAALGGGLGLASPLRRLLRLRIF